MDDDRSLLGLEVEQTFLQKLGLFLSVLIVGPLLGLLVWLALTVNQWGPITLAVGRHIAEVLAVFWVLVLIFIWWRPPWFTRIYLTVERTAVRFVQAMIAVVVGYIAWAMFFGW